MKSQGNSGDTIHNSTPFFWNRRERGQATLVVSGFAYFYFQKSIRDSSSDCCRIGRCTVHETKIPLNVKLMKKSTIHLSSSDRSNLSPANKKGV